jgi:hypothetical protein
MTVSYSENVLRKIKLSAIYDVQKDTILLICDDFI